MGQIYYAYQGNNAIRLLQIKPMKRYPITQIGTDLGRIVAKANFPFFDAASNDIVGRYQGDEYDKRVDQANFNGLNLVILKDNSYHIDYMNGWDFCDIKQVALGCCPAAVLFKGKPNSELIVADTIIKQKQWTPNNIINRIAILRANNQYIFAKGDGYSVDGFLNQIRADFPKFEFIALGDAGGSAELIIDGKIKGTLTDGGGRERPNYCCAAFVEITKPEPQPEEINDLMFPCIEGWGSQDNHEGHALDIGVSAAFEQAYKHKRNLDILACADGVVEYEGYYEQIIRGVRYMPIGVMIRHSQFSKHYDYVSIYWHLSNTVIDLGQEVKKGQKIGTKGNTGISCGTHLHFTIIKIPKGAFVPSNHRGENAFARPSIELKDIMFKTPRQWFRQNEAWNCKDKVYHRDISRPQVEVKGDGVLKFDAPSFDGVQINGDCAGKYCPKGYYNLLAECNGFAEIDPDCWIKIDGSNVVKL